MIICTKCGAELDDNARYCGQCGNKINHADLPPPKSVPTSVVCESNLYCCKCGAVLPKDCASCLICGTDAGATPPYDEPEAPAPKKRAAKTAVRKHPKRLMLACIVLCSLLTLSAASIWLVQSLSILRSNMKASARGAIFYLTEDDRLKFKTPLMDFPQDIVTSYHAETTISGLKLAKSSPNGRYIAYLNEYTTTNGVSSGRLSVRDFGQKNIAHLPEVVDYPIADYVTSEFFFTSNGTMLVFLTADGMLCSTDFTNHSMLDEDVFEVIDHTETRILYTKKADDLFSAHVIDMAATADNPITFIGDNIIALSDYTAELDKFIYLRENTSGSHDAISYDMKLDKRLPLAVGVSGIVAADAREAAVLYQTSYKNPLHYDNLIDDEFAADDEKIKEPNLADFPLLDEFHDKYGVDEDYEGSLEYEEIVEEKARFQAAADNYFDKTRRDKSREEIHKAIDAFIAVHPMLYDLHLSLDGATTKIDGGSYRPYDNAELNIDADFVVWQTTSLKNFKKIAISESVTISSPDVTERLNDSMSDSLYLQQFGRAFAPVSLGEGQFYATGWKLTEKGDGIYFAMGDGNPFEHADNACKLYYTPIQNGVPGTIIQIDENISAIGPMLSNNRLLYYKDVLGDSCDLYLMDGNIGERIGGDVSLLDDYFKIENNGKTLIYCERFNKSSQSGNMFLLTSQNRQLTTEGYRVFYRDDSLVYFLRNYKNGKAELYSFGGDGLVLIDENVVAVME